MEDYQSLCHSLRLRRGTIQSLTLMIQSSFKYKYCDPRQYFIAQVIKSDSKAIFNMTKGTFYLFFLLLRRGKYPSKNIPHYLLH